MAELRIRRAVRALLVTPEIDVLMVRFEFPARTVWALPGGGLEPGEDHVTALHRELDEEVGLVDPSVGPHIWDREHIIPFEDKRWDGQRESVYLVPVARRFEPRPTLSWEELRAERVQEIRWWALAEIESEADVSFAPRRLGELLRSLRTQGPPTTPIATGI